MANSSSTAPPKLFDIIGRSRLWLTIGGIAMLMGIIGMIPPSLTRGLTPGRINFGLDFTGGAEFRYKLPRKVAVGIAQERELCARIRNRLSKAGLKGVVIQVSEGDIVIVRTQARDEEQSEEHGRILDKVITRMFPGARRESTEVIGPVIGRELKRNAIKATVIGLIGILGYIWFRYDVLFGVAAIIALVHDVLVTIAFVAFTHIPINSPFVAVLLTVVGYSVNDSVVIFDRIRENVKVRKNWAFPDVVNYSLIETMARSINTTLTTQFPLWAMVLFGGLAIKDVVLPMLVGITAGAYSSIFIAAPFVVWWRMKLEERQAVRRRPVTAPAVSQPSAQPAPATATGTVDTAQGVAEKEEPAEVVTPPVTPSRATPKKRKRKKGKRRRRY